MTNLSDLRREYSSGKLSMENTDPNPILQFQRWFEQISLSGLPDSTAMVLSTSGANNRPSSRIVLLKEFSDAGFTFFTNYTSKKGKQIDENPYGSILFPWHIFDRQIRVEGRIEKLSEEKSDGYFENRPVGSRIGSWTSPQSEIIPSREFLEEREKKFQAEFEPDSIPRPIEWGGYILIPSLLEFWQGRESRLHDRIEYRLENELWGRNRLAP